MLSKGDPYDNYPSCSIESMLALACSWCPPGIVLERPTPPGVGLGKGTPA